MEKYRTTARRFWAGFVDGLVFLPLGFFGEWVGKANLPLSLLVAWMLFSNAAILLYNVLMHGFYGQTLGKMALGVKVLDVSESPISMRQAFLRESVYIVFNAITVIISICLAFSGGSRYLKTFHTTQTIVGTASLIWFYAEILTCLTNQKRRAIHDFIAGTVVVKTTNVPFKASEA
jgi:uncharacterized RDD family membrane protein YckC